MNSFVNPIKPRGGASYSEALPRIKAWTKAAIPDAEATISVNELACVEPGCPPRETVILVMWAEATVWKLCIHKSMIDVTKDDVLVAVQAPELITRAGA
jgi:hypothetical protein